MSGPRIATRAFEDHRENEDHHVNEAQLVDRLVKLRENAFLEEAERDRPLVELTRGNHAAARAALSHVRSDYYEHARWQSMRAYAVRAIALLHTRPKEGRARAEEMGAWFVGGSAEGHALALHALLGSYDRLEAYPPWPTGPTRDESERLTRRNAILRDEVRATFQVRLALLEGRAPTSAQLRDENLEPSLGFEGALATGDLALAERFAKRMIAFAPSWMDTMHGRVDPRAEGTLALARVHRRRGQNALVTKRVDECLRLVGDAITTTRLQALVLGASVARELGLESKAKTYLSTLTKQAPRLGEIVVDDLSLRSLEESLGEKGRARRSVREGDRALEDDEHEMAAKAYASVLGRRPRLDAEGRTIAARWLVSLARAAHSTSEAGTATGGGGAQPFAALLEAADALLSKDPGFVSAREARAYALARLGRVRDATEAYRATGLARLFDEGGSFEVWSAEAPERALSPHAVTAEERAEALLLRGVLAEALEVLAVAPPVATSSPLRFVIAGTIWNATVLESPEARRASAEDAWRWLAPLAMKPPKESPYAIELPVLAAEILAGAERHAELVKLPIASELQSYPTLTNRAFARLLPHLLDAHLALGAPMRVIEEVERLFDDNERERTNRTILERLVRAEKALGRPEAGSGLPISQAALRDGAQLAERAQARGRGPHRGFMPRGGGAGDSPSSKLTSLAGSAPDAQSLARELANRAWTFDQRGEIDAAIEGYLRAAELDPAIGAIGLGNAGNLARHHGRIVLARAFFDAALVLCSFFPLASRALVLAKVGHLLADDDPASALPLFALAFETAPSAELAGHLARVYDALGDETRAREARAKGASLEPRHPTLRSVNDMPRESKTPKTPKTPKSKTPKSKTPKTPKSKTPKSKTPKSKTAKSKTEKSKTEKSKTEKSKTEKSKTAKSKATKSTTATALKAKATKAKAMKSNGPKTTAKTVETVKPKR